MSDPPAAAAPAGPAEPEEVAAAAENEACPVCRAALASDQEWCVECGSARTPILPPPDWRVGVAIVIAVIAVVVLVLVIVWP